MNKANIILIVLYFLLNPLLAQVNLTTAVDFSVTDKNEIEHTLFDILDNGQYVLIDFFTTTCTPCCDIWPDLDYLYTQFGCNATNLFVLGIEGHGTEGQLESFDISCTGSGIRPVVSGMEGGGAQVFDLYQPAAYPTIILIAPDRTILEYDIWPFNSQIGESRMLDWDIEKALCPIPDNIKETAGAEQISFSPNPSLGTTKMEINAREATILNIELINLTGQTVKQIANSEFAAGYSFIDVDTSNYPTGTYFVKVTSAESTPHLTKLVIVN